MARKILLADDSVTAQNMGRKILADAGYEVLTVNNGSAALKKIAEAKPELIVLDVYMPGYSGLEVCQRLKEAGETSRIPILLTVGKLEPFKPEEARRVRADAFIVKPFEASELLSALSKLEDKIVPGRESHKPGRFARANATIDSYDKTVAIEEDSSWKNRISFPTKKKKDIEEDGDDPAIYNALNKDLRTVVEHKPAAKPAEMPVEPDKIDLGALAPAGLPKDVTPEEIAALAAAAAQIKGTSESKVIEEPAKAITEVSTELKASEPVQPEPQPVESKAEAASAQVQQPEPVAEAVKPVEERTSAAATAEEKIEQKSEKAEEPAPQESTPLPNPADVMAALVALEPETQTSSESHSGRSTVAEPVEEPITMAVAAGAEHSPRASRWTAVPAALAPDELSLSLEQEMQKAHAAFAAAEVAHSATPTAVIETEPAAEAAPASSEPIGAETPEVAVSVPTPPEVAEASSAVANAAAEAVTEAVKELEAVAASYESQLPQQETAELPASVVSEQAVPVPEAPVAEPPAVEAEALALKSEDKTDAEPVQEASGHESSSTVDEEPKPVTEAPELNAEKMEAAASAPESKVSEEDQTESHVSSHVTKPDLSGQFAAGGNGDMGKKEAEIAETTAAAWASWRRVREDKKSESGNKHDGDRDEAAMAVAAGAEKSPEAAEEETPEIASIVDSVLADLRPKIVEEISRKLGKKK